MPLDATNFVFEGTNKSADHLQFYNLLTGVMNDQPVTIANSVTVGATPMMLGANPTTNMPFIVPAVSGALVFGTNQVGRWQIALGGDLQASANGVYNIGGTALNRPSNIYLTNSVSVGDTNRLVQAVAGSITTISVRNAAGYAMVESRLSTQLAVNAYFDGTQSQPWDTTQPSVTLTVLQTGIAYYSAPAGAGPVAWVQKFTIDPQGTIAWPGGGTIGNYGSGYVVISQLTVTPGPTAVGNLTVNGSATVNGALSAQSLALSGTLNMNNNTIQYINTLYGHNNGCYMDMSAGTGVSLHGTLQVDGTVSFISSLTVSGGLAANAGASFNNLDLQFVRTLYGQNNTCNLTNDGSSWTLTGAINLSSGASISGSCGVWVPIVWGVNGYYWNGISGVAALETNGSIQVDGGSVYLESGRNVRVFWDGAHIQMSYPLYAANTFICNGDVTVNNGNIHQGGNYFYLYSDNTRWFYANGASITYNCANGGNHYFMGNGMTAYTVCYAAAFTPSSARKFKTDIQVLADPLRIVMDEQLHGVRYTEKSSGERKVGFVADDWLGALPEVVELDDDGDVFAFDYDRVGAVTFEALKLYIIESRARLDALERRLAA